MPLRYSYRTVVNFDPPTQNTIYILYFAWADQRVQQFYNIHLLYFVWEDQRQQVDIF